jgi:hypothetical protein
MCNTKPRRKGNKWYLSVGWAGWSFLAHVLHRCGCYR